MSNQKQTECWGEMKNGLQALVNILFLIGEDRKHPDRMLRWVSMATVQTRRMALLLPESLGQSSKNNLDS
jgi:hypothetical protein